MPEALPSFILFLVVATASPGGATTLATASGAQFGFARSIPLLLGIAAGLAVLAAAAASGLAALLHTLPVLELALKSLGTAYLLWLAVKIGAARAPNGAAGGSSRPIGFAGGVALLLLNPKGWAMTLGAAASFSALSPSVIGLAMIMAGGFALAAMASLSLWCAGGSLLASALRSDFHWRVANILLGSLLALSILPSWLP